MKVKNISGEDRKVGTPSGPLVIAKAVYTLSESDLKNYGVYGFTQQTDIWEPADAETRQAHDEAQAAYEEAIAAADAAYFPTPGPDVDPEDLEGNELDVDKLKGQALADALADYGLDDSGTADQKRARIAAYLNDNNEKGN